MLKLKPEVAREWEQIKTAFRNLAELFLSVTGGRPTATVASGESSPLRLNLQFFAEENKDKDDPTGGSDDPNKDKDTDPPGGDEDDLSLADLIKSNPKIKSEMKDRIEKAVMKRFKNIDPEEARIAIAEKQERDNQKSEEEKNQKDDAALTTAQQKAQKFELKAKDLAVREYAVSNGLDAKLISRLAAAEIQNLQLNEDMEADADDLDEIVEGLKTEFPNLFAATDQTDRQEDKQQGSGSRYNGGSNQKTNQPPNKGDKGISKVDESWERIKKTKRF